MFVLRSVCAEYENGNTLKEISLTAQEGKVTVLLGASGSGKSAVCDIVCGLLAAESGSDLIDGIDGQKDPIEAKRHIAYVPENPSVYRDMIVRGQLKFVGQTRELSARGLNEQVEKVIKQTGLSDVANMPIRNLPEAYLQRVAIAQALMGEVSNIVLDAPTKPLDAKQRLELRAILKEACAGKTVLLATDNISEAVALGDDIYLLSEGAIAGFAPADRLGEMSESAEETIVGIAAEAAQAEEALKASGMKYTAIEERDGAASFRVETGIGLEGKMAVSVSAARAGLAIVEMRPAKCDLSGIILKMENEAFAPEGAETK